MWGALAIAYVVEAAIVFVSIMVILINACLVILIGVVIYEKFQESRPELCGAKEEEHEQGKDD